MTIRRTDLIRAQVAGGAAYAAGTPVTASPYSPNGDEAARLSNTAWLRGWRTAESKAGGLAAAAAVAPVPDAPPADPPPADAVTPPAPDANGEVRWPFVGVMTAEDVVTGDGRKFTNLTWADVPMGFRAQFAEQPGHDDARLVGRIESITRDGSLIRFTGTWDDETLNPDAAEARRHNINGQMRGVSMDADQGTISFEDGDGNPLDSEQLWDLGPEDEVVLVIDAARIRTGTVCMIPAFVEAYVVDETVPEADRPTESVTAATSPTGAGLTAAALMAEPAVFGDSAPAAAFNRPSEDRLVHADGRPRSLNIDADGRIAGYVATWGTCHIGIQNACVTPPQSSTGYAYFLTGEYLTCDGETVPVGVLTMDTGHAGEDLTAAATIAHYDHTGTVAGYVTVGEDDRGIWQAGIIRPGLPREKVELLRASGKVSGDWRRLGGNLELVANLAVNVAGFPVPAVRSRVASGHTVALVAAGAVIDDDAPVTRGDLGRLIAAGVESHLRAKDARERLRRARARTLVGRIDRAGRR